MLSHEHERDFLREETGNPKFGLGQRPKNWGFEERTFRLKNKNGCYTWKYDDNGKNVYGRIWKTEKGARRFIEKKMKGTYLTQTKLRS